MVEDSLEDADLVMRQVRLAGYEADGCRVDTEAEYLAKLVPDLDVILSDYSLPQFSAPRALELVHQSGFDIPFIIISGTIGEDTAVAAMRQGASDYLLKDRLTRLGQAIDRAVEQGRQRRLRAAAENALRESQERFDLLADTIADVFWIRNADSTQVQYISPGYQKIWGRSCDQLYLDPQCWLEAVHPEDRESVRATAYLRPYEEFDQEYRVVRPDGSIRWIHDHGFPVRDGQGNIRQIVGVARDVTQRRQLEADFRQAQKMEALGQLAAGVAHDFNNLLTVIKGNASLCQMPDTTAQDVHVCAGEILLAADSAVSLTSQLLMFSRRNVVRRAQIDINDVVARTGRMLERVVGADVAFVYEQEPALPPVLADPAMIEQVLINLVVNARDAMPEGGRLIVKTSATAQATATSHPTSGFSGGLANREADVQPKEWVCLSVCDSGQGISDEHLTRLFEPFFTTKAAGKGTGLGLATVFGIVEQHQGLLEVRSKAGVGSTFRVLLPACHSESAVKEIPKVARTAPTGGTETILVVEDENAVRMLLVRLLSRYGYRVLEAVSGVAALEVWREHKDEIALLLTDMVMPDGLTGLDLAERLRHERPSLGVVVSSGFSAELVTRGKDLEQSYCFLQKPYGPQQVAAVVRQALDQQKSAAL
jgi:PAS domain S-box-containing protein